MSAADPFGLVGQVLDGQFRIDDVVGEGGFSAVYRGHHQGLGEPIAIKCLKLPTALAPSLVDTFVQRFRDESRILYRLSQGNLHIVRSIAAGTTYAPATGALLPYMVLEWLEGRSMLNEFAVRRTRGERGRPIQALVELFDTAADGLAYAHTQGVAHRDLNPGNLFLATTPQGVKMKVLDFGVAKLMRDGALDMGPRAQTQGHIKVFAPAYGAPEQFDDRIGAVGAPSDVYSFALILLEALRDKGVVEGTHLGALVQSTCDPQRRPTPRSLGVEVSDEVEQAFARATTLDPAQRWRTAGEFWQSLTSAVRQAPAAKPAAAGVKTPLARTMPLGSGSPALPRPAPRVARPHTATSIGIPLPANNSRAPAVVEPLPAPPQPSIPVDHDLEDDDEATRVQAPAHQTLETLARRSNVAREELARPGIDDSRATALRDISPGPDDSRVTAQHEIGDDIDESRATELRQIDPSFDDSRAVALREIGAGIQNEVSALEPAAPAAPAWSASGSQDAWSPPAAAHAAPGAPGSGGGLGSTLAMMAPTLPASFGMTPPPQYGYGQGGPIAAPAPHTPWQQTPNTPFGPPRQGHAAAQQGHAPFAPLPTEAPFGPSPVDASLAPAVPKSSLPVVPIVVGVAVLALIGVGLGLFAVRGRQGSSDATSTADSAAASASVAAASASASASPPDPAPSASVASAASEVDAGPAGPVEDAAASAAAASASADPPASAEPAASAAKTAAALPAPPTPAAPSPAAAPRPAAAPWAAPTARPPADPYAFNESAARTRLSQANGVLVICRKGGTVSGPGRANVTFALDGTVTMVIIDPPYAGTKEGECAANQFRRAKVAAFTGSPQTLKHTFDVPK